jgi:hypothetical protein
MARSLAILAWHRLFTAVRCVRRCGLLSCAASTGLKSRCQVVGDFGLAPPVHGGALYAAMRPVLLRCTGLKSRCQVVGDFGLALPVHGGALYAAMRPVLLRCTG